MPKVTTVISFEEEEYGRGEVSTFTREVGDLDPQDMLWFMVRTMELAGYQCDQLQMISGDKIYKTDW